MEDWLNGIWSKVEIVEKCPKLLISVNSFFYKEYCIKYFLNWCIIVILDFLIVNEEIY